MPRYREPQQLASTMAQHQKRKQSIKARGRDHAQVNGGDRLRLVAQKSLPPLRPRPATLRHVFRDGGLGDLEPQHQQFAVDPGRSPDRVFPAHLPNEVSQATIDSWAPCPPSRLPAPERPETRPVPAKDSLWLNHPRHTEQVRPQPGHPNQQRAVAATELKAGW